MSDEAIVPISANLVTKVQRLFKAGALTLAAGFLGLLLVVFGGRELGGTNALIHGAGSILVGASLTLMLAASRKARGAASSLKDELELLDDLQRTALQITEIADITQTFAFMHLMRAQKTFASVSPFVRGLPIVGPAIKRAGFVELSEISSRLAMETMDANNRIRILQKAIRKADLDGVREYGKQLTAVVARLRKTLNITAGDAAASGATEATQNAG